MVDDGDLARIFGEDLARSFSEDSARNFSEDLARVLNNSTGNNSPHGIAEKRTPNPKLFFQFIFFFKLFSEKILLVEKV